MTSSLDTGKTKTSLLGVKNYCIELKPCTLVEDSYFYNMYSGFWKCRFFYFVVIFQKRDLLKFLGTKKNKISEIRDSHAVDIAFLCIAYFCFRLPLKPYFWWIFKHLPFNGPKSGVVTSQNSTYSKTISPDFVFLCMRRCQIDSRRGVPSFMSIQ